MKRFFLLVIFIGLHGFSQNILFIEKTHPNRALNDVYFDTAQFTHSSSSKSRPYKVFVVERKDMTKICERAKNALRGKQEYTDIYVLGLDSLQTNSEKHQNVLTHFLTEVIRERNFYRLPVASIDQMRTQISYLDRDTDICEYLKCL